MNDLNRVVTAVSPPTDVVANISSNDRDAAIHNITIDAANIVPALSQTFGVMATGFAAGRLHLITGEGEAGLASFVGNFALPSLVFGSLVSLSLADIDWRLMAAVAAAKATTFACVFAVALLLMMAMAKTSTATTTTTARASVWRSSMVSTSALFAVFATQSNDFAFGLPIFDALYGGADDAGERRLPDYLYYFAPLSLVLLNPLAFAAIAFGQHSSPGADAEATISAPSRHRSPLKDVVRHVAYRLAANPVVVMTIAGVALNPLLRRPLADGRGDAPPLWLTSYFTALGSTFSASALFLLGLSLANDKDRHSGNRRQQHDDSNDDGSGGAVVATTVSLLVAAKSLALPGLARWFSSALWTADRATSRVLTDFAFLYGTLPAAPSVYIYARHYRMAGVVQSLVATALVVNTIVAAPLIYLVVMTISIFSAAGNGGDVEALFFDRLRRVMWDVSVLDLVVAVAWLLPIIWRRCRRSKSNSTTTTNNDDDEDVRPVETMQVLFYVVAAHAVASLASIVRDGYCTADTRCSVYSASVALFAAYATRIGGVVLAVVTVAATMSPSSASRYGAALLLVRRLPSIALMSVVSLVAGALAIAVALTSRFNIRTDDPNFAFGQVQVVASLVVYSACGFAMTISLLLLGRRKSYPVSRSQSGSDHQGDDNNDDDESMLIVDGSGGRAEDGVVEDDDVASSGSRNETDAAILRRYAIHRRNLARYVVAYLRISADASSDVELPYLMSFEAADDGHASTFTQMLIESRMTAVVAFIDIAMIIGAFTCLCTLTTTDAVSGVYITLAFLDALLHCGQSISIASILFTVFGKQTPPCWQLASQLWRRMHRLIIYGRHPSDVQRINLAIVDAARESDVDQQQRLICARFMATAGRRQRRVVNGVELADVMAHVSGDQCDIDGQALIDGHVVRHVLNGAPFVNDADHAYEVIPELDDATTARLIAALRFA